MEPPQPHERRLEGLGLSFAKTIALYLLNSLNLAPLNFYLGSIIEAISSVKKSTRAYHFEETEQEEQDIVARLLRATTRNYHTVTQMQY
jgi:hypothetical protein